MIQDALGGCPCVRPGRCLSAGCFVHQQHARYNFLLNYNFCCGVARTQGGHVTQTTELNTCPNCSGIIPCNELCAWPRLAPTGFSGVNEPLINQIDAKNARHSIALNSRGPALTVESSLMDGRFEKAGQKQHFVITTPRARV